MARDPLDSSTANMAITSSFQGYLTDEQKAGHDKLHRQMQREYWFDLTQANRPQATRAMIMSDKRQAIPAIIVREHEEQSSDKL